MIIVVIRTLILYTLVIVALRLMGKREIGQLQPFELVVILMISDLAAVPSENVGIPLLSGIIPILVLLSASLTLAWISLKSEKARDIICGKPSILIERGQIIEEEMKKNCYNLTDLLEELRLKNVPNIADVEFAILENNGQLSVIPKAHKRPTIPEDFHIMPQFEGLPLTIIMDGKLNSKTLEKSNKTLNWLKDELKKQGTKIEDVLLASLDSSGTLYVQAKLEKKPQLK
ncbi:DUF421 domain-containing protein [Desulfosporosinus metallidurans]|uniref:YetF C-terminal domain-containing protein n=1 Tax=Desulfosporosinus metallidurans TaxID=1888891 RepID=A0A1Q8QXB5_9FIRM|nr:DUF421 domain-containing protein [Desulfosporosinus metallidurans]OLN31920.1 protein of unknown function DUF421 [Desulfosporosinus metallidurans]